MRQGWKIFNLFVVILMAAISAQGSRAAQPAGKVTQLPPRSDKQAAAVERSRESEPQEIIIWKVGDPHKGELPDTSISSSLEQIAEKMGFRIAVRAFPAVGFARKFFDAFDEGQEPDILAINNYGIIDGIKTALGDFTGIGSNKAIREKLVKVTESLWGLGNGGWEFLVTSSKHADVAESLALRSLEYGIYWGSLHVDKDRLGISPLSTELQASAAAIALAYLQGDRIALAAFEDRDRLHADIRVPKQFSILEIKVLGMWGDTRLAFVPIVSIHKSANQLGHISLLLILRKQDSQWKLLAASTDPSSLSFQPGIHRFAKLLRQAPMSGKTPLPAKLLAPNDGQFPIPPQGQRFGDFVWQPSTSSDIVAQIVEFAYKDDVRLFFLFSSYDFRKNDQISAGRLWTTFGPWRWRVWSISDSGAISFSESRSFQH